MLYGEKMIEFLTLVKNYAISHVHSYNGNKAVKEETLKQLIEFNMDDLLAKNIKII